MWRDIQLDVDIKKKNYLNIEANQADDLLLTIYLYNNGVPLNLVSGEDTVIVNYVNANNTITSNSDIGKGLTGNQLKLYCPRNCTNSAGIAKMQVTINTDKQYTANKQVTTFPIEVKVNKSIVDGQEVSTNVNSIIDAINSANIKGQQVIKNITETANKYPPSSQLYADVEDLKVREYGAENLLQDSCFNGSIGTGFPWRMANADTTYSVTYAPSLRGGNYITLSSEIAQPGILQVVSTGNKLKSAYTVSLKTYGTAGNIVYISLHGVETKSYTIKSTNVWEDVTVTFSTNISNWSDKQLIIFGTAKSTFLLAEVALWEGKNAFSFKSNSQDCLYDRIRIDKQDVLAITKSGKYCGVGCTNVPFGSTEWAYYDIDVHSTTYKKITAKSYNMNITYENTMNNGTWTGWQSPLLRAFPIGSIKLSSNNTNPGTYLLGSTWTLVGQGRNLVGVGEGTDSNNVKKTFSAGNNAGQYSVSNTHNHSLVGVSTVANVAGNYIVGNSNNVADTTITVDTVNPSYGVYIWLRTA